MSQHCTFCFRHQEGCAQAKLQATGTQEEQINSGALCSYGFSHEFGSNQAERLKQPAPKQSKDICLLCSLHKRNPAMKTSDCQHQYPA